MTTFQTSVGSYLAPGVKGGWASANPSATLLQPSNGDLTDPTSGSWRVAASGVIIGNFAFADTVSGDVSSAHPGTGPIFNASQVGTVRIGFVQRDQLALITAYLGGDTLTLFEGQAVSLLAKGDVFAEFAGGAAMGAFVFASYADGSPVAGNTNTPPTTTFSATTVSGSANLTAVGAGAYAGQPISGTGIPAGAYLVSVNTAANTAVMSANATASGTITVTAQTAALTDWRVDSVAAATDIAKISVWG